MRKTEDVAGFFVDCVSESECVDSIVACVRESKSDAVGRCRWLACMNPHSYAVALHDHKFSAALRDADWLVADGVGVVIASKILGGGIKKRITGSDIFFGVMNHSGSLGVERVFFLGSTESVLADIRVAISNDYPGVKAVGTYSPPFKSEYSEEEIGLMLEEINKFKPDVLWVGMTAPKQEKWIFDNKHKLDVGFCAAIGAVFDFYTGRVKRSSPVFQRLGLEWLPRLMQQPRRLWRRMFVSAPIFLWCVLRSRFRF